jgi:hypothetical protein
MNKFNIGEFSDVMLDTYFKIKKIYQFYEKLVPWYE